MLDCLLSDCFIVLIVLIGWFQYVIRSIFIPYLVSNPIGGMDFSFQFCCQLNKKEGCVLSVCLHL